MAIGSSRRAATGGLKAGPGRRRSRLAVESLEAKALLSHVSIGHHADAPLHPPVEAAQAAAATAALPGNLHIRRFNQPGPIKERIGEGFAVKVPRFYGLYTGPLGYPADPNNAKSPGSTLNGYLNASGLKAYVEGNNLVLTGIIAGFIQASPTSDLQSSYYNFGINRGGATRPGPFPGRAGVTFDSVVTVGITPSGIGATVTTLDPRTFQTTGFTVLNPYQVATKTDAVQVIVPLSLLPSTGASPGHYRVNFFPSDTSPPNNFNDLASFLPEDSSIRVKTLKRYPKFPNGGGTLAGPPPTTGTGGQGGKGGQGGSGNGPTSMGGTAGSGGGTAMG